MEKSCKTVTLCLIVSRAWISVSAFKGFGTCMWEVKAVQLLKVVKAPLYGGAKSGLPFLKQIYTSHWIMLWNGNINLLVLTCSGWKA